MSKLEVVLASSSKIRRAIASNYSGVKCTFCSPNVDEQRLKKNYLGSFEDLPHYLAKQKALSIIKKFPSNYILGCDQICLINNKILEKPLTKSKAEENLKLLAGKTHQLIGGYHVHKDENVILSLKTITNMKMKKLTNTEIKNYIELDDPLESCGSYKFESNGYALFDSVDGSVETINGLPFEKILLKLYEKISNN